MVKRKQKRILVTGAGGFIGHHLCRYLKKKGYWVRGVDLVKPQFSGMDDFHEFLIGDLKDPAVCLKATRDIEWAYNLAALNGSIEFTTDNKAELIHNNALVNLNMAEACWKNKVRRAFYASSACVYPIHFQESDEVHALNEDDVDPAHPDTEYGWEKLFSEHVWKSYEEDRGLEVRIARFINIYGPECLIDTLKSKAPMALTRKVIDAGEGGDVKVWGDGGQKRTFCYVDDCVRGVQVLMASDVSIPINIGSDVLFSIDELVDIIAEIEGVKINKVHQLDKVQGVRTRHPDLTRARKLLGWKNEMEIKEGLKIINKFTHHVLEKK